MEIVVVERSFPEPVEFDQVQAAEDAAAWCLQLHHITFVRSFLSLDGRRMVCVYLAPDAESVRKANQTAGLPFDRVWSSTEHGPGVSAP
jgi:hypothetical protein